MFDYDKIEDIEGYNTFKSIVLNFSSITTSQLWTIASKINLRSDYHRSWLRELEAEGILEQTSWIGGWRVNQLVTA